MNTLQAKGLVSTEVLGTYKITTHKITSQMSL